MMTERRERSRERSPGTKRDRSPAGKRDRSPISKRDRSPIKRGDRSPVKQRDRSPRKDRSPVMDHRKDRSPMKDSRKDQPRSPGKDSRKDRSPGLVARDVGSKVEKAEKPEVPKFTVDREKTCPLLLRVFCNQARHNNMSEYMRGSTPQNELQIYTWMDATLKELTGLIKEVNPESRRKGTYFDFAA